MIKNLMTKLNVQSIVAQLSQNLPWISSMNLIDMSDLKRYKILADEQKISGILNQMLSRR